MRLRLARLGGALVFATGCASKGSVALSSGSAEPTGPWTLVTDDLDGGVMLSGWSGGDTLRMVGGDLGGGPGTMISGSGDELCITEAITDHALWWIHGLDEGDWVAVGEAGTVLRSRGGTLERVDIDTDATLFGVWMDADDIWAVGGRVGSGENTGEIWRWDGSQWSAFARDLPGVLFKVWEDWFVGQDVAYQRVDDDLVEYPVSGRLLTVRGRDADDIWAVGGLTSPIVLHWDGAEWEDIETTGLSQTINGVWTQANDEVWIAGNYGLTSFREDGAWIQPDLPLTSNHLHAVWRHGDDVWWMGGNLFSAGANHTTLIRYGTTEPVPEIGPCP